MATPQEAKPDASSELPGDSPAIAGNTAQPQANAGAPSTEAIKADPPLGEASRHDTAGTAAPIEMVAEAPSEAVEEPAAAGGAAAVAAPARVVTVRVACGFARAGGRPRRGRRIAVRFRAGAPLAGCRRGAEVRHGGSECAASGEGGTRRTCPPSRRASTARRATPTASLPRSSTASTASSARRSNRRSRSRTWPKPSTGWRRKA